ncbi:hypothetical protein J6590_086692 [Homalodisca vitripennis]|nr:hypothetical protein J6590_086692 [Homalodisca vitripennis]
MHRFKVSSDEVIDVYIQLSITYKPTNNTNDDVTYDCFGAKYVTLTDNLPGNQVLAPAEETNAHPATNNAPSATPRTEDDSPRMLYYEEGNSKNDMLLLQKTCHIQQFCATQKLKLISLLNRS